MPEPPDPPLQAADPPAFGGGLWRLRRKAERVLVCLILGYGLALLAAGWLSFSGLAVAMGLWAVIAGATTAAFRFSPGTRGTRVALGAGLCSLPALLLMELSGLPWQPDARLLFFPSLAVCVVLLDPWVILAGAGVVAAHHLTSSLIAPTLVFPGGQYVVRVACHAVVLVVEASSLAWLAHQAANAISLAEASAASAVDAAGLRRLDMEAAQARLAGERRVALRDMADSVEASARGAVQASVQNSRRMALLASDITTFADRIAGSAEQAAISARQAHLGAEELGTASAALSRGVAEVAVQASETNLTASRAAHSGSVARERIESLVAATSRIGEMVQRIMTIAARTNLLALNASIEATRAGDAGKRFSVVAADVKSLAGQTARASEEIGRQIGEIRDVTHNVVAVVEEVGEALAEISRASGAIASAVEQQVSATEMIATNVRDCAGAMQIVERNVSHVASDASTGGRTADELRSVSATIATGFDLMRDHIVRTIRSATSEANRRRSQRVAVDRRAMVRIGGTSQFIRLRDLSPEGARLDGVTGLSVGSEGTLCLSLIGPNAAFQVRNVYPDGSCGVLFVQDRVAHDFADAVTGITQAVAEAA